MITRHGQRLFSAIIILLLLALILNVILPSSSSKSNEDAPQSFVKARQVESDLSYPGTLEEDDQTPTQPDQEEQEVEAEVIEPPKKNTVQQRLKTQDNNDPSKFYRSQNGQDQALWETVFSKRSNNANGFFIEFGARDGVEHSNTYFFEKYLGWHGILLEASPHEQGNIGQVRSKSAVINGAVCENIPHGSKTTFLEMGSIGWGGLKESYDADRAVAKATSTNEIKVTCYRLDKILSDLFANSVTHINYLSVDTEGSELQALHTFPWSKVTVDIVGVEILLGPGKGAGQDAILEFMQSVGYKVKFVHPVAFDTLDFFFEPVSGISSFAPSSPVDLSLFEAKRSECIKDNICLD